jgi:hypothetical protein
MICLIKKIIWITLGLLGMCLNFGLNSYYDHLFDILGLLFGTLATLFGVLNNHVNFTFLYLFTNHINFFLQNSG